MAKISFGTESIEAASPNVSGSAESADSMNRRRDRRADVTVRIDYASVDEMFSEFTRDINAG